ncbi:MAG: glycosyltransferase family 2 protein, partial [Beijerinckiaceae bacterium]|nr:glycosyltransferase family 2 protein [Beijerinckiaceae bacterium]
IIAASVALSMAVQGSVLAIVLLAMSLCLGEVRYRCRRRIVIALWGEATAARLRMYWRVERWLRPVWWSFHALCVFSAPGSRHIHWAGIDYWVRGPQDVEVSRPPAA